MADEAKLTYPPGATLGQDTGFQGYRPAGVLVWQPKKKPKGQDLSGADKHLNALLSSVRIVVEHALASVKRCRIVKDVLRNTKRGFSDTVIEIACALHNWRVVHRQPLPTLNLLAWANFSNFG
jgi:DDE superfamily endonuclease